MKKLNQYILIINEDEEDRYLLDSAFASLHWEGQVKFIDTIEQAIRFLGQLSPAFYPSLIILDLNTPRWSGGAAFSQMKTLADATAVPVTLYCKQLQPLLREALLTLGITACYEKSYQLSQVIEIARACVNLTRSESKKESESFT
jgi:CheY-like chemotaxis protein